MKKEEEKFISLFKNQYKKCKHIESDNGVFRSKDVKAIVFGNNVSSELVLNV